MQQQYYIEIDSDKVDTVREDVAAALRSAGFEVAAVARASQERGGLIYTESALEDLWFLESGHEYCDTEVAEGKPPHRRWGELSVRQREQFVSVLTDWMGEMRYEAFALDNHDPEGVFRGIALHCDDHRAPSRPWGPGQ